MKPEFSRQIVKNTQQNFMKILPMEAELFYGAKRRTYSHDEANSRFSQFCERA